MTYWRQGNIWNNFYLSCCEWNFIQTQIISANSSRMSNTEVFFLILYFVWRQLPQYLHKWHRRTKFGYTITKVLQNMFWRMCIVHLHCKGNTLLKTLHYEYFYSNDKQWCHRCIVFFDACQLYWYSSRLFHWYQSNQMLAQYRWRIYIDISHDYTNNDSKLSKHN